MNYCTWHTHGYGIKVSEIKDCPVERLQVLLASAPKFHGEIQKWLIECEITKPTYGDYLEFDQDFLLGLATILKEVIAEVESITLTACDDYDGQTYLVYEPVYPMASKKSGKKPE